MVDEPAHREHELSEHTGQVAFELVVQKQSLAVFAFFRRVWVLRTGQVLHGFEQGLVVGLEVEAGLGEELSDLRGGQTVLGEPGLLLRRGLRRALC